VWFLFSLSVPILILHLVDEEIDHGSRFAKSLGFYEDAPWSFAMPEALAMDDIQTDSKRRKKREVRWACHCLQSVVSDYVLFVEKAEGPRQALGPAAAGRGAE
jgi:hypothetical protein